MPISSLRTRELVALALPAALSAILNNAWRVVDQYAAQWLGTEAQAAISSFVFVLILCYAAWSAVAAGAGPLVARATGAGDAAERRALIGNALSAAVLVGAVVWGACALGAEWIASAVGLQGQTAGLAARWLRALALLGLPVAMGPVIDACFMAMGRAAAPMSLQLGATVANAGLNWLFLSRLGWGIEATALATGLSRAGAAGLGLWMLRRQVGLSWSDLVPRPALVRRIFRVGLPIAANTAMYALVYWALLRYAISPLGPTVNAALGIGFSALEGFTWPLFYGISLAVASLVGRSLGAGRPEEAAAAARLALPLSTAAGLGAAAAFYFGATPLCSLFTKDPQVLAQAVLYARCLAFSQVAVAWESLGEGVLEGAGDTRKVLYWSAPLNILRVPLAWALAIGLGWGAEGVWWAINLSTWVKAAGKGLSALGGGWRTLQI